MVAVSLLYPAQTGLVQKSAKTAAHLVISSLQTCHLFGANTSEQYSTINGKPS
jgi:hypothetical protein